MQWHYLISNACAVEGVGDVLQVGQVRQVRGDVLGCLLRGIPSSLHDIIGGYSLLVGTGETCAEALASEEKKTAIHF